MVAAWSNVVEQRVQPPAPGHSSLETMTQQDYSNDLVFRSNGEEYARIDGNGPWKSVPQDLFQKFASLAHGTFLEADRYSNFPAENTIPDTYEKLCQELVDVWDEVMRSPISYSQRRKDFCTKVEWIVSSARARLNNC